MATRTTLLVVAVTVAVGCSGPARGSPTTPADRSAPPSTSHDVRPAPEAAAFPSWPQVPAPPPGQPQTAPDLTASQWRDPLEVARAWAVVVTNRGSNANPEDLADDQVRYLTGRAAESISPERTGGPSVGVVADVRPLGPTIGVGVVETQVTAVTADLRPGGPVTSISVTWRLTLRQETDDTWRISEINR